MKRKNFVFLAVAAVVVIAGVSIFLSSGTLLAEWDFGHSDPDVPFAASRTLRTTSINDALAFSNKLALDSKQSPGNAMQSSRDLRSLFDAYFSSSNGDELVVARSILRDCASELIYTQTYRDIVSGKSGRLAPNAPPMAPIQIAAWKDELSRCDGFSKMSIAEAKDKAKSLGERIGTSNTPIAFAERAFLDPVKSLDPSRLASVVATKDGVALDLAEPALALNWRLHQTGDVSPSTMDDVAAAIDLLSCDFGDDCSSGARSSTIGCMRKVSFCGLSYEDVVLFGKTEAQKAEIGKFRSTFGDAIQSGNYSAFGIHSS